MLAKYVEEVNKPIIYIALSLFFGSLCYGVNKEWGIGAIIIASIFLLGVAIRTNIIFSLLISVFLVIGLLINIIYYNPRMDMNIKEEVRIVENKGFSLIAEIRGRRVYLNSNVKDFKVGEKLIIEGIFSKEVDIERGIIGSVEIEKTFRLDSGFIGKLYELRELIYRRLEENIGKRRAGMVASLAFGYSDYLDNEDNNEMKSLGIIHAISVSGLHVALIFAIASRLLGGKIALLLTIIYVVFTGAPISSIRSLVMIICLSQSVVFRKKYNPLAGLALSLIILIVMKPYCIFQIGGVLSYSATLGIILFNEKINKKMFRLPKYIRETVSLSISAQVFTLPILILAFKEFSIWFIIGNLVIVPILNLLIILGNLLVVAIIFTPLFNFISYLIIKCVSLSDFIMDYFYDITNINFIVNKSAAFFFMVLLISMYFILKGYKKFYLAPLAAIIAIIINFYSIIPRIDYFKEGAILISYKGERKLITNKRNIDALKLKEITLADEIILEGKRIKVSNNALIEADGKDFIMTYNGEKYLLRMNSYGEKDSEYDIIDLAEGKIKGFFLSSDKLIFIK